MKHTILEYSEEYITPEMASDYLKNNAINRRLNPYRAKQYADDMKSGNWQLNGEAIGFYADGSLANGQHRLTGITIANTPVLCSVFRNIPKASSIQDRGRARNITDAFLIEGMTSSLANKQIVAVAKLHFNTAKNNRNVSDATVRAFIKKHEDTLVFLRHISNKKAKNGVSVSTAPILLGCFYALNCGVASEEDIKTFLNVLSSGMPTNLSQESVIILRNDIVNKNVSAHSDYSRRFFLYAVERAIADFCSGASRKQTYSTLKKPTFSDRLENKNA